MWYVNVAVTRVFDVLLWPFRGWPTGGLVFVSALTGVLMLLIFKFTSQQGRVRQSKNVVRAHLLAMRLFADDVGVVMSSQKAALRANLSYLRWAALPILFIFPPVILIMSQLNLRYGAEPVPVGGTTVVTATFEDAVDPDVRLSAPPGVRVETEACRVPYLREASWRVKGLKPGKYTLSVVSGGRGYEKEFVVGEGAPGHVSPERPRSVWGQLWHPGEPPVPGPLERVRLNYAPAKVSVWRFEMSWVWMFFIVSLAAAMAFKGVLKAEI